MERMASLLLMALMIATAVGISTTIAKADGHLLVYEGKEGPGKGKHIVLIAGDEEYRSEEAMPMLGRILAKHHGFKCTVLFSLDPETGEIDPNNQRNIPGTEALNDADLMIINTRFRNLPDEQMKPIDDYLKRGGPVIGMRTATHAFKIPQHSKWAHYGNGYNGDKAEWKDGFGRLVLGEKWINHHGRHKVQGTRGIVAEDARDHPINRGIKDGDVWGPSDVYGVRLPLPGDSKPVIYGQVQDPKPNADRSNVYFGMTPDDPPTKNEKQNDPMMPIAWTKSYQAPGGMKGKVFTTTIGASTDLTAEGSRRMLVNGVYWVLGMEDDIPAEGAKVDFVGKYEPNRYGNNQFNKGVKPSDLKMD